jgi:hypothetical protein
LITDLRAHKDIYGCLGFGQYVHLSLRSAAVSVADITEYWGERPYTEIEVTPITPDIEDCFIAFDQLTGN